MAIALKIKNFILTAFLVLSPAIAFSSITYQSIQLDHSKDLKSFKRVKEGPFDPAGSYVLESGDGQIIKVTYEDLKNKNVKEMKNSFQRKILQFSLLFEQRSSPYQGAITVNTECFEKEALKKKVVSKEGTLSVFFDTKATRNFAYGKCDGESVTYFSKYFAVLCEKQAQLFDVKYFAKNKKDLEGAEVKCLR
ncbi:hypothetical protein DOM21_00955 [Bacteriovorax stolpii]|uniref:hypothetical protein n=1 Tax=Bacteriovorax stolpii TaxID=960 RepID=UPI001156D3DC|nr:hypothetical protein [Bacteriovorax stolpii]QDK40047.1 hypothetical protein DOM21_00955 [Bacteriovorax stolpii]